MSQNLASVINLLPQVLYSGQITGSSAVAVLTAAANTGCQIKTAGLNNATGSPITVTVSLVQSGQTIGTGNQVITTSLTAGQAYPLTQLAGSWLGPGDALYVQGANVNVWLTGIVNS